MLAVEEKIIIVVLLSAIFFKIFPISDDLPERFLAQIKMFDRLLANNSLPFTSVISSVMLFTIGLIFTLLIISVFIYFIIRQQKIIKYKGDKV
jgi:hypothetical protein